MAHDEKNPEEGLDNTTAIRSILDNGDIDAVKMILGDRERIKHSGVIRPGIKVCLSSCTPAEKKIYDKMYAEGHSFDDIDKALGGNLPIEGQQGKYTKSKLRPSNCDYFTVRREDFRNPSDADMINKQYADADGRVRRLKIWFPVGDRHLVLPHGYRGFSGDGSVKCYSEFDDKGKLICHYIPADEQSAAKKEKRRPQFTTRPCDHEHCAAYERKHCDFGGMIKCNIKGMKGMGEVIIPTTSIYGLSDIMANLKRVQEVFGRFSGLFNGEPFFELCKIQEDVKAPDGSRQKQWIPTIDLCVDMTELAQYSEKRFERGPRSFAILNGEPLKAPATFEAPVLPPEPGEMAEGTTDEPEVSPEITGAIAAIEKLTTSANIPVEHFEAFVSYSKGVTLASLTIDELRKLYAAVKKSVATESAAEDFRSHCQQCFEGGQS